MNNASEPPNWPVENADRPWKKFTTPKVPDQLKAHRNSNLVAEYKFLNDSYFQGSGTEESQPPTIPFTRFSQLPLELRLRIWEHCLPSQRLLRVLITRKRWSRATSEAEIYQNLNRMGNIVSGAGYVLRMISTGSSSPLRLVNREANRCVRQYYRIHIPVIGKPEDRGDAGQVACLCLHPETDTVLLDVDNGGNVVHFADLVHDALAYDHQGIGILHMAIKCHGHPSNVRLPLQPSAVHSRARAALSHTLGRLQSISLIHTVYSEGRQMFASRLHAEARFNRAFPIWSRAASFTVLHEDPRPIAHHLEKVCVGADPRAMIRVWQMLEAAYKPSSPANTTPPSRNIRVLLAAVGTKNLASYSDVVGLANREEICCFRQREEDAWKDRWRAGGFHDQLWHGTLNPDDEDPVGSLEFAKTNNAVGFWSVPLEAFGDVPEVPYDTHFWAMSRVLNLTEFKARIECGLFEI